MTLPFVQVDSSLNPPDQVFVMALRHDLVGGVVRGQQHHVPDSEHERSCGGVGLEFDSAVVHDVDGVD